MARKRKYIDRKLMKQLAQMNCSNQEIATALRVSHDTIERRYACAIKKWKEEGVCSVRRELFTVAMGDSKGKVPAMIFFLKNYGGMADVVKDATPKLNDDNLPVPDEFKSSSEERKPN